MSKIFEEKQYSDGGPNDRGVIIGYVEAESKQAAREKTGITHNFIQFVEIPREEYERLKAKALALYRI